MYSLPPQGYNQVQNWKYNSLPEAFAAEKDKYSTYTIKTRQELEDLLKNDKFSKAEHLQVTIQDLFPLLEFD